MPSLRRLEPDEFPPEVQDLVAQVLKVSADGVGGPFNLMLRSPEMGRRLMALLSYFNDETQILDPQVRRLAVLMLARRSSVRYAWWTHRRRALSARQFTAAQIDSLNQGARPGGLDPKLKATFDFVLSLMTGGPSDAATSDALRQLGEVQLVELVALCGTYTTVAYLLKTGDVDLPEGESDTLLPLAAPFSELLS
ncbi:hypothetical protein PMI07_006494 [Rhizobium sp. CF080]|uniref:carboxymuconolactone decarboxylase family protein n=1 Tax=Rhizobium sp. (strain CF080) TaxID=1144310 RepID=UPI0002718163|nr:hypothetical protein [Rhizobium sp. CF080]EUB98180.1 hypothetical protein PMI07_006494 [Rhizobium sp. CF080]